MVGIVGIRKSFRTLLLMPKRGLLGKPQSVTWAEWQFAIDMLLALAED